MIIDQYRLFKKKKHFDEPNALRASAVERGANMYVYGIHVTNVVKVYPISTSGGFEGGQ